jgi:hypothetical protein
LGFAHFCTPITLKNDFSIIFIREKEKIMEHEATTRLAFFFGILVLVALGELLSPRRVLTMPRPIRIADEIS